MYETTSILDLDFYTRFFTEYLKTPKLRLNRWIILISCNIFIIAIFMLLFISTRKIMAIILWLIILIGSNILFYKTIKNQPIKAARNVLRPQKELTGHDSIQYVTHLEENGIYIENIYSGSKGTVEFQNIIRFMDVCGYYILITTSGALIPINKNALSENERVDFINDIKSKPTKIQWNN